jgi:hypothetical protein
MKITGSETKGVREILSYAISYGNACLVHAEGYLYVTLYGYLLYDVVVSCNEY